MSTSATRAIRVMSVVLGVVMAVGGITKLVGEPHQVTSFARWGLPYWFLLLVGSFEVVGGAFLLSPATTPIGSLVLSTIMVGAIWTHLAHAEWVRVAPGCALLAVFLVVFLKHETETLRLLGAARQLGRAGGDRDPKRAPSDASY